MADGIKVTGYKEFLKACDRADKETKKFVRETFRDVGDIVKDDAQKRLAKIDERSAAGLRTVVRQRGVSVEQSLRKTTGEHPEFGTLQMEEALLPALDEQEPQVGRAFSRAIDKVADNFDRKD